MDKYDVCINVKGEKIVVFSCFCPFDGPDNPFLPFGYCNVLCKALYGETDKEILIDSVMCDNEKCVARTNADAFGKTCEHGNLHRRRSGCDEQCPRFPESRCIDEKGD